MRRGCSSQDGFFTVIAAPNKHKHGRIGLVVSRKASPKAVTRNRIKRQIRESFRVQQRILQGLNVVVVAHAQAVSAPGDRLRASLRQHWQEVARRCKSS